MTKETSVGFQVQFLGGFSLRFGERRIEINGNLKTKSTQLLLVLLKAGNRGIPRNELAGMLEGGIEGWGNQLNNLRHQTYTLRRLLQNIEGLPEGPYIVISKGCYYFTNRYTVETDTGRLDQWYRQLQEETEPKERLILLQKICSLYARDFLPMLPDEEWVSIQRTYYRDMYTKCFEELRGCGQADGQIVEKGYEKLERSKEPYHCSYNGFLDVCRALSRMKTELGLEAVLLICSIRDSGDLFLLEDKVASREAVTERTRWFQDRLWRCLRSCDLYTCRNRERILILLPGMNMEAAAAVKAELERLWAAGKNEAGTKGIVLEISQRELWSQTGDLAYQNIEKLFLK